ncbi:hypothetical protein [Niveispirillum cyanobacteriorum]|uniref:hypothetical protein n=1 Tax=Niveispirillum cyanobacteriorum TaxID=1612173 RepID=UPI001319BBA3|nr:hypothetical protein [Niveispirillum cyanobacteriorum]GGE71335.1 hypothetical protein GCM10011317_30810 [Niveispirillum cyanobacteriorum]
MAGSRLSGKLGLLFAALSGVGAASIVGELLRALPQAAAIAEQNPMLLVAAPIPVGAVVAIAHIFWLRSLAVRSVPVAPPAAPARTLVPPPDDGQGGGNKPPRWRPVIRN